MRMPWALAVVGWLTGCGPLIVLEGDSDSDGEGEGSSTGAPGTTAPPPGTTAPPPGTTVGPPVTTGSDGSTTGEPETTSLVFLDGGNDANWGDECDFWEQDCPAGEKCMPWANDGGNSWNALRCSPIADNPDAPGEPCTVEGSGASGIDSCELGAMCWDVDPDTLEGVCVAFCVGSPERPACEDADAMCVMGGDGVLALCIPVCDPLQQDCSVEGNACYPVNDSFICAPDASGDTGAPGDACEFINVCDPGSFCASAEVVPECMGAGCCTLFCDLDMPLPCLPGQECTPWYEAGMAPPGFENLGACALPT
jgi:hypothetical protein